MLELPIPSTFNVEQSAAVGESVGARGRTANYAYKSENIPYHVLLNKHGARCLHKQHPSRSFLARIRPLSFEVTLESNSLLNFVLIVIECFSTREVRRTHNIRIWNGMILCEPRLLQRIAALSNPRTDGTSRKASFARTLIKYFNIFSSFILGIILSIYKVHRYVVSQIKMHWLIFLNNIIW